MPFEKFKKIEKIKHLFFLGQIHFYPCILYRYVKIPFYSSCLISLTKYIDLIIQLQSKFKIDNNSVFCQFSSKVSQEI